MSEDMAVHVTEAEVARDVHATLAKIRQGIEVVIKQDSVPVAVLKAPQVKGRRIYEVIASLKANGANAVIDEDFARDVEAGINAHSEPWSPPSRGSSSRFQWQSANLSVYSFSTTHPSAFALYVPVE